MTIKVIISGGGTGGHIFPALSIADQLKQSVSNIEILFVGAQGKMEMERVPAAGYKIVGLPIMGMPRKLSVKMFQFIWKLWQSNCEAKKIIENFKPDFVVGVGGFASYPVLNAAAKKEIPTFLQEQNSYAGVTNKKLSQTVKKICVAYDGMQKFFPAEKLVLTGNPIRKSLLQEINKEKAIKSYQLTTNAPIILIVGGSLGAKTLNESMMAKIDELINTNIQFIWQTGKFYYKEIKDRLKDKNLSNIKILEFISDMDTAYAASDIVIARAGASTISELCALGKATILVPSPNVAEDHQTKNAMALVEKNAAIMVKDADAIKELVNIAVSIVKNEEKLNSLKENIKKMAKPNATQDIVKVILENI